MYSSAMTAQVFHPMGSVTFVTTITAACFLEDKFLVRGLEQRLEEDAGAAITLRSV